MFKMGSEKLKLCVGLILFCSASGWKSQEACPSFGAMESFEVEGLIKKRYLGRWYHQLRPKYLPNFTGKCWSQEYSRKGDRDPYSLTLSMQHQDNVSGEASEFEYEISIVDSKDPNLFEYYSEQSNALSQTYRVLATDYETFAVEYSCQENDIETRNEQVWVLTRDRHPARSVMRRAQKAIHDLGLKSAGSNLVRVDQECIKHAAESVGILPPIFEPRSDCSKHPEKSNLDETMLRRRRGGPPRPPRSRAASKTTSAGIASSFARIWRAVFAPWSPARSRRRG